VILLPAIAGTPDCTASELLEPADGLCLIGGGDLDPATYGQVPHAMTYGFNAKRDEIELSLARYALDNGIPLLAICRGCQVVNVACGGTLHQHLGDLPGVDEDSHGRPHDLVVGMHPVIAEPGSRVAAAIGGLEALRCTSAHHQCVDRVGAGLQVTGRSPDGCIEALETAAGGSFALAVQWHPEITTAEDPQQQGLFDRFVTAARDRKEALALSLA